MPLKTNSSAREPQTQKSQAKFSNDVWTSADQAAVASARQPRPDIRSYRTVSLSRPALAAILQAAPMEFTAAEKRSVLTLPEPDGTFERFSIAESPIMAPELAARFPEIKTYIGSGLDDPTATTRFDWTPLGFHAIILSEKGTMLIEPNGPGDVKDYIVYFQKDVVGGSGECDVTEQDQEEALARNPKHSQATPAALSGTSLRTYRLAAAATAEYTQAYGGGTVQGGLSAITTTVNLVDAIYEREVAIRLTLIAGEDSIIFTDTTTDGYTTDNVSVLISENQNKLNTVIGAANYDIGHVFDGRLLGGSAFSWQGLAQIGGVCVDSVKARGVDILLIRITIHGIRSSRRRSRATEN
ncbi:MAG TPA: zinc-dependent metalloprotease family protein [Pyrinomonadaceae bacterium]|nr:zinc-dependent metalloprotease family protein [Pyrinomonadaceae bacterium]